MVITESSKGTDRQSVLDLFTFSASLGSVLTGAWLSQSQLLLRVVDSGHGHGDGASSSSSATTRIGSIGITTNTAAALKSADGSSLASNSSANLTGTWGAHPAVTIASVTAADGVLGGGEGYLQPGLGAGDTLTVRFDQATNMVAASTKAEIDALLTFSASIGSDYTGQWSAEAGTTDTPIAGYQLVVTVVDAAGAASPMLTKVHALSVTVNAAAGLRSMDLSSPVSTPSMVVALGTWGDFPAPSLASAVAVNTGGNEGLATGDSLVVTFNSTTNRGTSAPEIQTINITAANSSLVGGNFTVSYYGHTTGPIAHNASAADLVSTLEALPSVGAGGVTATRSASYAGNNGAHQQAFTWAVTFNKPVYGQGGLPLMTATTAALTGTSVDVQVTESRSGNALLQADVDALFAFTEPIGSAYSGYWLSATAVAVNITASSATNYHLTKPGTLQVSVRAGAGVRSMDGSSAVSTASAVLASTWGDHTSPSIVSLVATDAGQEGLSDGDNITLTFDKDTNRPHGGGGGGGGFALNSSEVTASVTFSSSIGSRFRGVWTDPRVLVITVVNTTGQATTDLTKVATLTATLTGGGADGGKSIRSADESSPMSTATSPALNGTWGKRVPPNISSIVATNNGGVSGLSDGDKVTVTFDKPTSMVAASTKAEIDALLAFSASVGSDYTGQWTDSATLVVTIVSAATSSFAATRVGVLRASVNVGGKLTTADESSDYSVGKSPVLAGSWGARAAPNITSIAVSDDDVTYHTVGYGDGDIITVTFDVETNQPTVSTKAGVDALFSFSASGYNGVSINMLGSDYTGVWSAANVLRINITDASNKAATAAQLAVGSLRLTTKPDLLFHADLSSNSSVVTAVVGSGTYGDHTKPAFLTVTASDTGGNEGLGDGDTLTVVFDKETNQPFAELGLTKSEVDALFSFSFTIGSNYTAVWTNDKVLTLRILNATETKLRDSSGLETRVGLLKLTVKASASLKSADESSPASDLSGYLNAGTWGNRTQPNITSITASNAGSNQGLGNGDTITVTFDKDTNRKNVGLVHEEQTVTTVGTAASGVTEVQTVVCDATGGDFTITFDAGVQTAFTASTTDTLTAEAHGRTNGDAVTVVSSGTLPAGLAAATTYYVRRITADTLTLHAANASNAMNNIRVVDVTDTGSGTHAIKPSAQTTSAIAYNANAGAVKTALEALTSITTVTVSSGGAEVCAAGGNNFTISFDAVPFRTGDVNQVTTTTSLTGGASTAVVTTTTAGSSQVGGTFFLSLTYNGVMRSSANIAATATGAAVKSALEAMPNIGTVSVSRGAVSAYGGYVWRITFESNSGDVPLLSANGYSLTGSGASVSTGASVQGTTVGEVQNITTYADAAIPSGTFTVTHSGQTTSAIQHNASADDMKGALEALSSIGVVAVSRQSSSSNGYRWMVTFLSEGGDLSLMTVTDSISAAWTGGGAQIQVVEARPGAGRLSLHDLFTFSASLGNVISGSWASVTTLVITIVDATGAAKADQTRTGVLYITVKSSGLLKTADESSPASMDKSPVLVGSWGAHDAPGMVSVTAKNAGSAVGLDNNDVVTIVFDKETNRPSVDTKAGLDALFVEVPSLGSAYTGSWTDYKTLAITVVTASTTPADLVTTRVGSYTLTLNASGSLKSLDESSTASSNKSAALAGTWGNHPAPSITSITAADGQKGAVSTGLNDYDTVTVVFDRETSRPAVATKANLDALFSFSASLGSGYTGTWDTDYKTLVVNITSAATSAFAGTRVGSLILSVKAGASLQSADLSSPVSQSASLMSAGTWGDHTSAVSIASITASNTGSQEGLGNYDTVTVAFDKEAVRVSSSEVQTITTVNATAGTFTVTYNGMVSAGIAYDATAAAMGLCHRIAGVRGDKWRDGDQVRPV